MSKKILIASLVPTHPTTVGNRARLLALSSSLRELGHDVHFAYAPMEAGSAEDMRKFFGAERLHLAEYHRPGRLAQRLGQIWRRVLARLRLERAYTYGVDDWYDRSLDAFFHELARKIDFDVVIVVYVFLSRALLQFPSRTLKIIDTHDRFTDRHQMFLAAGQHPGWFSTTLRQEVKGLERAEVVLAIEGRERDFFAKHLPRRSVLTVGHIARESPPITSWEQRQANSILLVGTNYPPNLEGLKFVLEQVLPLVHAKRPEAFILLAGTLCFAIPDSPHVQKLGVVKEIADAYARAWVATNPVYAGSGQCIKSLEALGYGMPLVTTRTGARGLPDAAPAAFIQVEDRDAQGMADALIRLLDSNAERTALSQRTGEYVRRFNELTLASLLEAISMPIRPA